MASILCRKGETFPKYHTHTSVQAVRDCQAAHGDLTAYNEDAVFCADCAVSVTQHATDSHGPLSNHGKVCSKLQESLELVPVMPITSNISHDWASWVAVVRKYRNGGKEVASQSTGRRDPFAAAIREAVVARNHAVQASNHAAAQENPWKVVRALENVTPAGRYAITEDGVTKFYIVQKGKDGTPYAGRTFVKVQASDDLYRIKTPQRLSKVLSAINEDQKAAMLRYGLELGSCGHCGRTLTDAESRAKGIGPVCAGKLGW
jgi:hypothetical protein